MAGRKPIPTSLKILRGNPGRRRLNALEPKPGTAIPDPPEHLTEDALVEWVRITKQLEPLGLVSFLDRAALAAYCQAYGRWACAERELKTYAEKSGMGGLLYKTKSGNVIPSPLLGAANKAMADMVRYATEFGLTPSARVRVRGEKTAQEEDPAAKYFKRA
jgi:P27 family predicted phage terminase small subunit